jgi:hypothetical protein
VRSPEFDKVPSGLGISAQLPPHRMDTNLIPGILQTDFERNWKK